MLAISANISIFIDIRILHSSHSTMHLFAYQSAYSIIILIHFSFLFYFIKNSNYLPLTTSQWRAHIDFLICHSFNESITRFHNRNFELKKKKNKKISHLFIAKNVCPGMMNPRPGINVHFAKFSNQYAHENLCRVSVLIFIYLYGGMVTLIYIHIYQVSNWPCRFTRMECTYSYPVCPCSYATLNNNNI